MIYVVKNVYTGDTVGVFDSYEKTKEYCMWLYKEFYNADEELWETPEKVSSCFDEVRGIEDLVYFDEYRLNEGKGMEFFF